jgi:hypothetical protein
MSSSTQGICGELYLKYMNNFQPVEVLLKPRPWLGWPAKSQARGQGQPKPSTTLRLARADRPCIKRTRRARPRYFFDLTDAQACEEGILKTRGKGDERYYQLTTTEWPTCQCGKCRGPLRLSLRGYNAPASPSWEYLPTIRAPQHSYVRPASLQHASRHVQWFEVNIIHVHNCGTLYTGTYDRALSRYNQVQNLLLVQIWWLGWIWQAGKAVGSGKLETIMPGMHSRS